MSLYVFSCAQFIKVGIAKDPFQRLSNLQVGNPLLITPVYVVDFEDELSVESDIHRRLSRFLVSGEWFIGSRLCQDEFTIGVRVWKPLSVYRWSRYSKTLERLSLPFSDKMSWV